jgi:hypothetical protein
VDVQSTEVVTLTDLGAANEAPVLEMNGVEWTLSYGGVETAKGKHDRDDVDRRKGGGPSTLGVEWTY